LHGSEFHWGVNGHPNVQEGYRQVPLTTQLDLVARLGAGWYRCDVYQGSAEKDPNAFDMLVAEATRRGIRILPVIFPSASCRDAVPPDRIRQGAFEFARSMAARCRGRITHWELDNELDLFAMVRKGEKCRTGLVWQWGDPDGDRPEHFEESRYQRVKAELTGLHEGIKAGDPGAKTIVDTGGWLHYGFFDRLIREDGIAFDILGWHWYSEMGDMTRVRGNLNVLDRLRTYGKPIWITEINRRGGSQAGAEDDQAAYLSRVSKQLRNAPGVEAFFVYELLDEPYFGRDDPESHYGLVRIVRGLDDRWRMGAPKPAYHALAAVFQKGRGPVTLSAPTEKQSACPGNLPDGLRSLIGMVTTRSSAAIPGNPFGTQTTSLAEGHEVGRLPDYLKEIADAGYKWVKDYIAAGDVPLNADWKRMWAEFPPHYEQYLRTATGLGTKVILRLDYPRWRGQEPTTPEAHEAVAHFFRQVVRRHKTWVKDWEIDNEVNIGNEKPRVAPEEYVSIVKVASRAIRAEDPQARVYAPAMAMLQALHAYPFPYIPRLLDAGLAKYIDVFSFHPYRQPYQRVNIPEHASEFHPWQVWGSYRRQLDDLRARLRAKGGREVPIAATEVGYPTHTDRTTGVRQISLATQAKYEQRMMIADFALGVRPRIQFIFKRPWNDPFELEHQFNLVNSDGTKRPAYRAVQNVTALFDDTLSPAPMSVVCDAPVSANPQVYTFIRKAAGWEEIFIALWAGIPADDDVYSAGTCRLTIASKNFQFPMLVDLMQPAPIEAIPLPFSLSGGQGNVESVPLHDSPIAIRLLRDDKETRHPTATALEHGHHLTQRPVDRTSGGQ
jgi:hypothetical protein